AQKFESGAVVSPDAMADAGLVRKRRPVKVLGGGDLDRALTVQAHGFTRSARQKIEQAGGSVEVVGERTAPAKKPPAPKKAPVPEEPAARTDEGAGGADGAAE
ncbi:MAG TPA: uL15m family ribosomal protein, partial [Actinomycetota bacterium]|nr:uL15m family ribosomal protein [Actinomycetota bacterium]